MSGLTFSGDIVVYLLGLAVTWGMTMARIGALEKKVEKHNNLIERVYALEGQQKTLDERIKVANHRIEDLEKE